MVAGAASSLSDRCMYYYTHSLIMSVSVAFSSLWIDILGWLGGPGFRSMAMATYGVLQVQGEYDYASHIAHCDTSLWMMVFSAEWRTPKAKPGGK